MADEKQDLTLSLSKSSFYQFSTDIFLTLFNFFSISELGKLRAINKFFMQRVHEIIFFSARTHDFLSNIFCAQPGKMPLTKRFFREQIHRASQAVDGRGIHLAELTDYSAFPEKNIILRDATSTKFSDFYHTALLNKILFKILIAAGDKAVNSKYHYFLYDNDESFQLECKIYSRNGIEINTMTDDFFEHCILYRFNMLPSKVEAKSNLRCYFQRDPDRDHNNIIIGVGCSDTDTIKNMKTIIESIWPVGWSSHSTFQFERLTNKYGNEHSFSIQIEMTCAIKLFITNPIHMALHLLNNPEYFAEEDFQESCEVLLIEIEKFCGFYWCYADRIDWGVPDEQLNELKSRLLSAKEYKRWFVKQQARVSSGSAKNEYEYINNIVKQMQQREIETDKNNNNHCYMEKVCQRLRLQAAIKTIEESFKINFHNKAACQATFKQIINAPELNIDQTIALFNRFKDREELNRHRNPRMDRFFGIKNTTSWRATWKEIRDNAKQKLFDEVKQHLKKEHSWVTINRLSRAEYEPLFCEHRNNTIFKGAFGFTRARKDINAEKVRIWENNPKRY